MKGKRKSKAAQTSKQASSWRHARAISLIFMPLENTTSTIPDFSRPGKEITRAFLRAPVVDQALGGVSFLVIKLRRLLLAPNYALYKTNNFAYTLYCSNLFPGIVWRKRKPIILTARDYLLSSLWYSHCTASFNGSFYLVWILSAWD